MKNRVAGLIFISKAPRFKHTDFIRCVVDGLNCKSFIVYQPCFLRFLVSDKIHWRNASTFFALDFVFGEIR